MEEHPYRDRPIHVISLADARLAWWRCIGDRVEMLATRAAVSRRIDEELVAYAVANIVIEINDIRRITMKLNKTHSDFLSDVEISLGNQKLDNLYAKSGDRNVEAMTFYYNGGASLEFVCKTYHIREIRDEEFLEVL